MTAITEDIQDQEGNWVKSFKIGDIKFHTRSYQLWNAMNSRCKAGGATQRNQPSYVGCVTNEAFKDFQYFTNWHVKQIGYGAKDYQLDKDLLIPGNRVYSETACVLIPRRLNTFISIKRSNQGEWPVGVCYHKTSGRFQVRCNEIGRRRWLGTYETIEDAYAKYVEVKESQARLWAERLRNGEYLVDSRVILALENWRVHD